MYEIRFYYKNDDVKVKKEVVYHLYNSYEKFEDAYKGIQCLIKFYSDINVNEVVFSPSFPKEKIEAYTLFLSKKGKEFSTIVKV